MIDALADGVPTQQDHRVAETSPLVAVLTVGSDVNYNRCLSGLRGRVRNEVGNWQLRQPSVQRDVGSSVDPYTRPLGSQAPLAGGAEVPLQTREAIYCGGGVCSWSLKLLRSVLPLSEKTGL